MVPCYPINPWLGQVSFLFSIHGGLGAFFMIMIFLVAVLYFLFRFDLLSLFLLTIVSSFFTSAICSVVSALYLNGSHLFPLLFSFVRTFFTTISNSTRRRTGNPPFHLLSSPTAIDLIHRKTGVEYLCV